MHGRKGAAEYQSSAGTRSEVGENLHNFQINIKVLLFVDHNVTPLKLKTVTIDLIIIF